MAQKLLPGLLIRPGYAIDDARLEDGFRTNHSLEVAEQAVAGQAVEALFAHILADGNLAAATVFDVQKRWDKKGPRAGSQAQGRQFKGSSAGRSFIPAGDDGVGGAEVDGEFMGHNFPVQIYRASSKDSYVVNSIDTKCKLHFPKRQQLFYHHC
jgi:hypothetical protein